MTNEIEKTKRGMYDMLEAMRKAKKHPTMLRAFEEALEEHLEALRKELDFQAGHTSKMREKNDEIQQRLHAVDHAYLEQSQLVGAQAKEIDRLKEAALVAGEELRQCQTNVRHWREEAGKLNSKIKAFESDEISQKANREARQYLDDCRSAEKLSDDLSEKLTNATTVIGQQEQLIAGQRSAIAGMHAELTHSRVIRKAFIRAQEAFTAVDAALHESAPYNAQKALGDDLVDAEFTS